MRFRAESQWHCIMGPWDEYEEGDMEELLEGSGGSQGPSRIHIS